MIKYTKENEESNDFIEIDILRKEVRKLKI